MRAKVEEKMQRILKRLNIDLKVSWVPNPQHKQHGLIEESSRTIYIFDREEDEAFRTFIHEIIEWRLKEVTRVYRTLTNHLIEAFEKVAYQQKEEFLDFVPTVFKTLEEERKNDQN